MTDAVPVSEPEPTAGSAGSEVVFEVLGEGAADLAERPDDLAEAMAQLRAASFADAGSAPGASAWPGVESPDQARDRVLRFCGQHGDALHRSCLSGHLTGSAVVVDPSGQRTLLLHHAKLDRWLQPGGHADGDGNLANVAWREATEETGLQGLRVVRPAIDIDIHTIPARPGEPEHLHLDVRFAVIAPDDSVVDLNHESLGARWVDADDEAVRNAPDLARAVDRATAVVRRLGRISG